MGIAQRIRQLLQKGSLKPGVMAEKLGISRQSLHRYLKELLEQGHLRTSGTGSHTSYYLPQDRRITRIEEDYKEARQYLLPTFLKLFEKNYADEVQRFMVRSKEAFPPEQGGFGFMIESSAVYSSNIEGNSLNLNSFLNSRYNPKTHRPKEAEEIEDLVEAYHFAQEHSMTEKAMLKAHGMLSRKFVSPSRSGKYRQEPVGVFGKQGLQYMAIEPDLVSEEMHRWEEIVQSLLQQKLSPGEILFWASWIHLTMVLIHPFADGNGRIARLCEKWFLIQKLGPDWITLPSEEYYALHRPVYYEALKLGANYWEIDMAKAEMFLSLLPKALTIEKTET